MQYLFHSKDNTKAYSQLLCIMNMLLQKEVISIQKQPSCEKRCVAPKSQGEKRCEIEGGGQEMAVIIVQWQKF